MTDETALRHYRDFAGYDTKYRFSSYWHQIHEVMSLNVSSVLEVGVGSGIVTSYLKLRGLSVLTLDVNQLLRPAIVASATKLPLKSASVEVILCCQVLEHLPFEEFPKALLEFKRVATSYLIVSLPDKTPGLSILLRVPNWLFWGATVSIPLAIRGPIGVGREHHWEIGRRGYSAGTIKRIIGECGLEVLKSYRVVEYPFHRFFVCSIRTTP